MASWWLFIWHCRSWYGCFLWLASSLWWPVRNRLKLKQTSTHVVIQKEASPTDPTIGIRDTVATNTTIRTEPPSGREGTTGLRVDDVAVPTSAVDPGHDPGHDPSLKPPRLLLAVETPARLVPAPAPSTRAACRRPASAWPTRRAEVWPSASASASPARDRWAISHSVKAKVSPSAYLALIWPVRECLNDTDPLRPSLSFLISIYPCTIVTPEEYRHWVDFTEQANLFPKTKL